MTPASFRIAFPINLKRIIVITRSLTLQPSRKKQERNGRGWRRLSQGAVEMKPAGMIQEAGTRLKESTQELWCAEGAWRSSLENQSSAALFFFFFSCLNHYILATNLVCWPTLKSDIWPIKGSEFSICCSTLSWLPHRQHHVRASTLSESFPEPAQPVKWALF